MRVTSGCGEQEAGVPHTTPLVYIYLFFFAAASLLFVHFFNVFRSFI